METHERWRPLCSTRAISSNTIPKNNIIIYVNWFPVNCHLRHEPYAQLIPDRSQNIRNYNQINYKKHITHIPQWIWSTAENNQHAVSTDDPYQYKLLQWYKVSTNIVDPGRISHNGNPHSTQHTHCNSRNYFVISRTIAQAGNSPINCDVIVWVNYTSQCAT